MENRYWLYSVQQLAAKLNDVEQCTFRISSPTIPHPNRRHPLQLIILSKILNSASDSSKIYGGHLGRDVGKIQPPNWSRAFSFLIICTALCLGTDFMSALNYSGPQTALRIAQSAYYSRDIHLHFKSGCRFVELQ